MNYTQKFYNTYIAKYKKGGRIRKAEEGEKEEINSYIYTVKKGDSPWKIAKNAGISLKRLASYNPKFIKEDGTWRTLHVGDEIYTNTYEYLPASNKPNFSLYIGQLDKNDNGSKPFEYTVKKGDTLSKIALKYNTNVTALLRDNPGIKNRDKIKVGQTIHIQPDIVGDPNAQYILHTVKPGEKTYEDIINKYTKNGEINGVYDITIYDDYGTMHRNLVKGQESWRQDDKNLSPGFAVGISYNKKMPEGYYLIQNKEGKIKLRPLIVQDGKLVVDNVAPIIVPKSYESYNLLSQEDNINRIGILKINKEGKNEWTILKK